jgi:hypothetical protein
MPVMDAKSYSMRTRTDEKKTIGQLFADYGCYFQGAQMDIDSRVLKLNELIENGQVGFFKEGFAKANKEGQAYKYPERTLGQKKANDDKPEDKRNHGVNATEFVAMETPVNLKPQVTDVYNPFQAKANRRSTIYNPVEEVERDDPYEGFGGAFHY